MADLPRETDYAELVRRAYETLRFLGQHPQMHEHLQGQQMARTQQQVDMMRGRKVPINDLALTLIEHPEAFRPPTNIYSGMRGDWLREPD